MRLLDRVNGKLDAEMCGVWVCYPDLQHGFSAAVQFAENHCRKARDREDVRSVVFIGVLLRWSGLHTTRNRDRFATDLRPMGF